MKKKQKKKIEKPFVPTIVVNFAKGRFFKFKVINLIITRDIEEWCPGSGLRMEKFPIGTGTLTATFNDL